MFLIDSNIFLEYFLGQKRGEEVRLFFESIPNDRLSVTCFSVHSCGVILFRNKKADLWVEWIDHIRSIDGIAILEIEMHLKKDLLKAHQEQSLDFDDSYQYVIAKRENLHLVSFDQDFDKTDLKRLEPLQALELWKNRGTA